MQFDNGVFFFATDYYSDAQAEIIAEGLTFIFDSVFCESDSETVFCEIRGAFLIIPTSKSAFELMRDFMLKSYDLTAADLIANRETLESAVMRKIIEEDEAIDREINAASGDE